MEVVAHCTVNCWLTMAGSTVTDVGGLGGNVCAEEKERRKVRRKVRADMIVRDQDSGIGWIEDVRFKTSPDLSSNIEP